MNMTSHQTFLHGSAWVRADFHLHTRRDSEFRYAGKENEFISAYVGGMKRNNIQVGVITNHNKFDIGEFKALRKSAHKEEILLLPGVELSIGDGSSGVHTLVVFSDEWIADGDSHIDAFLAGYFAGQVPSEYECKGGRSRYGIIETFQKLDEMKMDYFVVFAHVEQTNGFWKELSIGRINELGRENAYRERVLGFQKVRTADVPDRVCRKKVEACLNESYPAEVEGSDCKSLEEIGKGESCFVKIGEFSYESVKFALMNCMERVAGSQRLDVHSHIDSISFEGGLLDGQTLPFSPELNTLIGIRGSGKSAIIESLRYALDISFGENAEDLEYKKDLIPYALKSGGLIRIRVCDRLGMKYEIRRILGQPPEVYIDGILRPGLSIRDTIVHRPVYFGQKDLSSSGEGFEKDLVEKLLGDHLSELRRRIEGAKQRVRIVAGEYQRISDLDERIEELTRKQKDYEHKMGLFQKYSLGEKLQKQLEYNQDERWVLNSERAVQSYIEAMERFIADHEDELRNQCLYQSKQNDDFISRYLETYRKVIETLDVLKTLLDQTKAGAGALRDFSEEFANRKSSLQDEFAAVNRQLEGELAASGTQTIRPDDFKEVHQTLEIVKRQLVELGKQKSREEQIRDSFLMELSALESLWHEEFISTQNLLDKVNDNNSALRIRVEYKGDRKSFFQFLKSAVKGSNIRESSLTDAVEVHQDLGIIWKRIMEGSTEGVLGKPEFRAYIERSLPELVTYQVPNRFIIEYQGKELKNHSMGQRASALMLFILSQGENDVILIDQPEDDLDNQTLYADVIRLIEKIKSRTQFIFATHNPNIPVLGDAEQVMVCSFSEGRIHVEAGSIDSRSIQRSIVDIMEGGKEAIARRKEIYSLWIRPN